MTCQCCGTPRVDLTSQEVLDLGVPDSRTARVCDPCHARFDPDVWIVRQFWDARKPAVAFADLPGFR